MSILNRQQIVQTIEKLPSEVLPELASFIDYLQFKTSCKVDVNSQPEGVDFLIKIAGIGESDESDLSQRDEEILSKEINNISGWSIKKNS